MLHQKKPVLVGERVGAALVLTNQEIRLLGYGVFEGYHTPPWVTPPTAETIREYYKAQGVHHLTDEEVKTTLFQMTTPPQSYLFQNPRVRLDDGTVVWGKECWWGHEDEFKRHVACHANVTLYTVERNEEGMLTGTKPVRKAADPAVQGSMLS